MKLQPILIPTEDASPIWRDIDEYNGLYQVSNTGLVKGLDRIVSRKGFDYTRKGIMMSLFTTSTGYVKVGLTMDNITQNVSVARLVAKAFIPNPDNKPQVNHKDGNKLNNNVSNLEWCTASENQIHAFKTGLSDMRKIRVAYKGEQNGRSLLTQKQVDAIRNKYKPHVYTAPMLAKEYGVGLYCIKHILQNNSWKQ